MTDGRLLSPLPRRPPRSALRGYAPPGRGEDAGIRAGSPVGDCHKVQPALRLREFAWRLNGQAYAAAIHAPLHAPRGHCVIADIEPQGQAYGQL
jgi:hypothetical protein